MNYYENGINESIIAGNFPKEKLISSKLAAIEQIDISKMAEEGLDILRTHSGLSTALVLLFQNRVAEIDLLNNREYYQHECNVLINTQYDPDAVLPFLKLYEEAMTLVPFVTDTDKVFWFGSWGYFLSNSLDVTKKEAENLVYTWLYMLNVIEKKEHEHGMTINLDYCISNRVEIVDVILSEWSKSKQGIFTEIDEEEKRQLANLFQRRQILIDKIQETYTQEKEVATATENDWTVFIDLINDLSANEINTIDGILDAASPKEKLALISRYNSLLYDIQKARYIDGDHEYNLLSVFEGVVTRLNKAPHYCCARTDQLDSFILNPAIAALAMNPMTYNNLFIMFHQFRISPNKASAEKFFATALNAIQKNLGIDAKMEYSSLDEIVESFYLTVDKFVNDNRNTIDKLEFSTIQDNAVSIKDVSVNHLSRNLDMESMKSLLRDIEQSDNYDQMLEESVLNHMSIDQISNIVEQCNKSTEDNENKALARQIIISLNIIYIFCDALRISLNNKHAMVKIKNKEEADKYRRELLKIDAWIVNKVYSGTDVLEYRERYGVDARNLTDREQSEERYRNSLFADTLKDTLLDLTKEIETCSIEQIFVKKTQIKDTILSLPECEEKDQYAEWIDELSNHLCRVLVEKTQKSQDDYSEVKNNLMTSLGEHAVILPNDTVDSLTTAEILYHRYASEEYSVKGFDYSSISALYYQAFEAAYNKLIWFNYSKILNETDLDGQPLIDIMCNKRSFDAHSECEKYLGSDYDSVKKYIRFRSRRLGISDTTFTPYCMYGQFTKIMEVVKQGSLVTEFCNHMATLVGFDSMTEMLNDVVFMNKCSRFTTDIDNATGDRNNASHGGSYIDINQCKADKKTVLDNLEIIRSDSMGLIEQLIGIMTYKKA